jgi:dienelactone hydrolase
MITLKNLSIYLLTFFLLNLQNLFSQNINLLANPGFEKKSIEKWTVLDSCRFEIFDKAQHTGKRALAFYPLRDGAGVRNDISSIAQPGYVYAFTGFFRTVDAGWGQADVLLAFQQDGKPNQQLIGRADCNDKHWTEVSAQLFISKEAVPGSLQLVVKTAWGQIAFLADDLLLRPALQIQIQRSAPMAAPEAVFQMGPANAERTKLAVQALIFDSRKNQLRQYSHPLNVPVQMSLDPGIYRIHASLLDVDGRAFEAEKDFYCGDVEQLGRELEKQSNSILAMESLNRYHGWIRYLKFLCSRYQERDSIEADRTLAELLRLDEWTKKIMDDPDIFKAFSGVMEWAYPSRVDDSGQPFKIAIPTGYTSGKAWPLVVVMHGYGGNHMDYSTGVQSNPDYFELHVLGRARGGGYTDLSEADVLDAVDYVQQNWNIDDRRIHLTGASMGGGGTFKLSARYPHRWASGRPVCGYGIDQPTANMLHVPIYSTHSQDDPSVPVLTSRAVLRKLSALGGQVIIDETNGLQHAAWTYTEGNNRAQAWMYNQVRPEFRDVRRIEYTAVDRKACRAYWLEVAEWGAQPEPAQFKATVGTDNQLYLQLKNIRSMHIILPESPFEPAQDLRISVNEGLAFVMKAPLPDSVFVNFENGCWTARAEIPDRPLYALHTPGGAYNLYSNEPLLIVWGTGGDADAQKNMAQAALSASKCVNVLWNIEYEEKRDDVPNNRLLYGNLKAKPDTAVTETDLQNCHIILIGTAAENALVRKMQDRLPVQYNQDQILCSDGLVIPRVNTTMGLYFYNPLSPHKLIYWIAADKPSSYPKGDFLFQYWAENQCATDFLVVRDNAPTIVTLRHFDSRWNWSGAYEKTALIPQQDITYAWLYERTADAMRSITGSNLALYGTPFQPQVEAGVAGVTRWADIAALDVITPIAVMQMKGELILSHQKGFSQGGTGLRFYPAAEVANLDPTKIYQVAMSASYFTVQQLINLQNYVPDPFVITDTTIFEAMKRFLF